MHQDFIPYSEWLHRHDEQMRREYPDRRNADMAAEQGVDYYTVSRRAARLGIQKSESFMHSSWQKGSKAWTIKGEARKEFRGRCDEYMRAHFATTPNEQLARLFGVDVKTVRRWARRLGLQKSEAFMQEARGRGHAKSRQGYYTPEHDAWRRQRISEIYPEGSEEQLQALARELGIARKTLNALARKYGIRRSPELCREKIRQMGLACRKYSPEMLDELRAYYPTHTNKECAEHFGIPAPKLATLANRMGVGKSAEHKHRVYGDEQRRRRAERKKET